MRQHNLNDCSSEADKKGEKERSTGLKNTQAEAISTKLSELGRES